MQELKRVLGPWMATAVVIGTVIGSGVFKKPHAVAQQLTDFGLIMLAWVLVGVLAFFGSLILAEIAIIHPRAGGNYVFLREGYGRWAGFLWGWVEFWIIRSGSIAALATVFSETFHDLLRYITEVEGSAKVLTFWEERGVTVTVIAVLAVVNARGTVLGGGLQLLITAVKILSLLGIALLPFVFLALRRESPVDAGLLEPVWPEDVSAIDWSRFGAAMVGILWAYHGWMNLAPMAEEVKDPNRNLPLAFLTGTLVVMALYLSVNLAYHLVVSRPDMISQCANTPVATVFSVRLLGQTGLLLASLAVMISVFGALNGNLLVGPRLLFAMGRDGLAPRSLAQLHPRFGTPAYAQAVLTGWSIVLVLGGAFYVGLAESKATYFAFRDMLLNWSFSEEQIGWISERVFVTKGLFDVFTDYAMFGAVSFETLAVASIFVCRRQYPVGQVQLPYRCWGYPWIPIFYVAVMSAVLVNMFVTKTLESLVATCFIGVGAVVYVTVFAWRRAKPPLAA
jgi:amino acid transporter